MLVCLKPSKLRGKKILQISGLKLALSVLAPSNLYTKQQAEVVTSVAMIMGRKGTVLMLAQYCSLDTVLCVLD